MTAPALATVVGPTGAICAPTELPRLSVVVPCYNEAESLDNLSAGLARLRGSLAGKYATEIVLVDDGSIDGTWKLLGERFAGDGTVRLVRHEKNQGIAAAIATGIREATAEIIASLDADCTYEPLQLVSLLKLLGEDVDIVVASPYHPAGKVEGVPAWRLAISRLASRLYGLVMRDRLHTYTSCVRVYRKRSVEDISLVHGGFVGIVELLWQVDRRGGRIVECPAVLKVRITGQSKMRVARTAVAHIRFLTACVFQRLSGSSPVSGRRARAATNDSSRFATRIA
jgi:dolichol-phosphate mannosyltransferase